MPSALHDCGITILVEIAVKEPIKLFTAKMHSLANAI